MENELLELKARVESLDNVRKKLRDIKAIYTGIFRQIDTYYNSPKDRLKLREVANSEEAKLIYYDREDITGPKKCLAIIIDIQEPRQFKVLFQKLLGEKVIVDKEREIYTYKGTQIHLDKVQNLGTFIEFERKTTNLNEDQKIIEELMKTLQIKSQDLIPLSYSDLLTQSQKPFPKSSL